MAYEFYNKADDIHDSYYHSLAEPELVPTSPPADTKKPSLTCRRP
jgi:hypothetical protein